MSSRDFKIDGGEEKRASSSSSSFFFFASMNLLKTIHYQFTITQFYRFTPTRSFPSSSYSSVSLSPQRPIISLVSISNHRRCSAFSSVSGASIYGNQEDKKEEESERNYASAEEGDEVVYQKTLRLVECAMFAAVTGLVYFLSNSLAIEVLSSCFSLASIISIRTDMC